MSPLPIRRYRAEKLLRREFEAMRGRVLAGVRARLRAAGVRLDSADLEACYAQAWHGLYMTMLQGRVEVANPEGWLALVTYRRAIDEHRSRTRAGAGVGASAREGPFRAGSAGVGTVRIESDRGLGVAPGRDPDRDPDRDVRAPERDLAGELDDRVRLRQLMEGLRARLSPRERQAAALCYLQGLSRAQAAAQMGVSEARMRKLMDGAGPGSQGVASKVGELLQSISAGTYCTEQSSLMRGFAFGILDPDGERYALALAHQRECPACRAHVLSLRGLAAVLPPLPLPLLLGAGVVAGAGAGAGAGTGAGIGTGAGGATSAGTAGGIGTAAGVSTAGAGAGVGGGWLMTGGGLGAKLAVGCLVAVSVGAGCVALSVSPIPLPSHASDHHRHARSAERMVVAPQQLSPPVGAQLASSAATAAAHLQASRTSEVASPSGLRPAEMAQREFGIEHQTGQASAQTRGADATAPTVPTASAASAAREFASAPSADAAAASSGGESQSGAPAQASASPASSAGEHSDPSAAAREFGLK